MNGDGKERYVYNHHDASHRNWWAGTDTTDEVKWGRRDGYVVFTQKEVAYFTRVHFTRVHRDMQS